MKIRGFGLWIAPILAAAVLGGCGEDNPATATAEKLCGPCGDIKLGDVGISGSAKLDGFFKAVGDLNGAVLKVNGGFEADLAALEAAFGLTAEGDLSARVDALIAKVQGEISANVEGGLKVNVVPAKCSASMDVAVEAQANCEAKAECDVQANPGSVSVQCEGSCSGSCEGGCSADATAVCNVKIEGGTCEGTCEGSCQVEAGAACDGTCRGTCEGTCSATDANGQCAGQCDGQCQGTCELKAGAECSGKCSGSCKKPKGEAECEANAEVQCEGKCEGSCSGGCEGEATPPSASADCEASADCQAQAKAQASANVECTPPQVDISFAFAASADADAQAKFTAEIAALKAHGIAMLQGFTKYQALITGEVNGEAVFPKPPVEVVIGELNAVVSAGVEGDLIKDLPKGRLPCVIPAMEAAVSMLGDITSEAAGNLEAQGKFAASFTTGFSD